MLLTKVHVAVWAVDEVYSSYSALTHRGTTCLLSGALSCLCGRGLGKEWPDSSKNGVSLTARLMASSSGWGVAGRGGLRFNEAVVFVKGRQMGGPLLHYQDRGRGRGLNYYAAGPTSYTWHGAPEGQAI